MGLFRNKLSTEESTGSSSKSNSTKVRMLIDEAHEVCNSNSENDKEFKYFIQLETEDANCLLLHGAIINAVFSEKEPRVNSDDLSILWFKCRGVDLAEFRLIKVIGNRFVFHCGSTNLSLQGNTLTLNNKEYKVESVYLTAANCRLSPNKIQDAAKYISKVTDFSEEFIYNTLKNKLFTQNHNETITDLVDDISFKFSKCMVFSGVIWAGEEKVLVREYNGWYLYGIEGPIKHIGHFTNDLFKVWKPGDKEIWNEQDFASHAYLLGLDAMALKRRS